MASYSASPDSCKFKKFLFHGLRLSSSISISISVNGCMWPPLFNGWLSATRMPEVKSKRSPKSLRLEELAQQLYCIDGFPVRTAGAIETCWSPNSALSRKRRDVTVIGQAKQLAWMKWEWTDARKLFSLVTMEPFALSFLLRSTFPLLPNHPNHKQWGFPAEDTCIMCNAARDPPVYFLILWEFTPDVHLVP